MVDLGAWPIFQGSICYLGVIYHLLWLCFPRTNLIFNYIWLITASCLQREKNNDFSFNYSETTHSCNQYELLGIVHGSNVTQEAKGNKMTLLFT